MQDKSFVAQLHVFCLIQEIIILTNTVAVTCYVKDAGDQNMQVKMDVALWWLFALLKPLRGLSWQSFITEPCPSKELEIYCIENWEI